ncbi:hypothetical protein GCM10025868_36850 [Angustibacter aerolatus]|uniref:Uncharacterized protein n=1 Tax=Angustibacter aerolatus TaxID=1162965 RepID=A0ABQ6JNW6_9ACTN|nr:hypothetical protein GCM10025868_36850 [Angustibacter aerolatus]
MPVVVLVAAIGLEGFSFRTAIREANHARGDRSLPQFVRTAKAPEPPVVLLEDFAALLGLVFALFGVVMTLATDDGHWDAVGTGLIGVLLVLVAAVLAVEMKSLLLGESATPDHVRAIEAALVGDGVGSVIHMRTMHLGPDEAPRRRQDRRRRRRHRRLRGAGHRRRRAARPRRRPHRPGDLPRARRPP